MLLEKNANEQKAWPIFIVSITARTEKADRRCFAQSGFEPERPQRDHLSTMVTPLLFLLGMNVGIVLNSSNLNIILD